MLSRLFIVALWSPVGKELTFWLSFVMFKCVLVTFPCGILGQVWYLIVSIPDLCHLYYFFSIHATNTFSSNNVSEHLLYSPKIVSEYDQEIPQSQTADNPMAPRVRATQPSRDTRKTN